MVALNVYHIKGPEQSTAALIRFGTVLPDGVTYQGELQWLKYEQFWLMSWADRSGNPIISGIRVVANFNMLYPYSDPRLPDGNLICHDTQNKRMPPGRNDWRERHILTFVPRIIAESPDTIGGAVIVE